MQRFLRGLEFLYLMRFPLLSALVLTAGLPYLWWKIPSIFVGLFDAIGFMSFTLIVLACFQLAWTILVTSRLVLVYGPERFESLRKQGAEPAKRVGWRTVALYGCIGVPVVALLWHGTAELSWWKRLLAAVLGLGLSLLLQLFIAWTHVYIETDGESAEKVFPYFRFMARGASARSRVWRRVDWAFSKLPLALRGGFLRNGRLRSGHQVAIIALSANIAIYLLLAFALSPRAVSAERQPAALFFVLFLMLLLTWLLSGAAFLLDAIRVPVLTAMLALSLLGGLLPTDHEYNVRSGNSASDLRPEALAQVWEQKLDPNSPMVVVATAGGGIQASAWTAQVLTGFQEKCSAFGRSLMLISSVSGGSVGAMYFVNGYDGQGGAPAKFGNIRYNASRSSLSMVGWGLLYPDLIRTIPLLGAILIPKTFDRGWAIENAWVTGWKKQNDRMPLLSDWRADAGKGDRPAVLFNATSAETGGRFLIDTAELRNGSPENDSGTIEFPKDFGHFDMPIATAARLSASFPYISPMARPTDGPKDKRTHAADGGYYDNSGILTAIEWMQEAQRTLANHKVVFIVIGSSDDDTQGGKRWSWQRQAISPLQTIVNVRTSSQEFRDQFEDVLLEQYFDDRNITMITARLLYKPTPGEALPLSWHLTQAQEERVWDAWKKPTPLLSCYQQKVLAALQCGPPPPGSQECP